MSEKRGLNIGPRTAPRHAPAPAFERLEGRTHLSAANHDHHGGRDDAHIFWYVPPGEPTPVEETPRFVPTATKWSQPGGLGTAVPLSYSFSNLLNGALPGGISAAQLTDAIEEAMQVWTAVSPLRLTQRTDSGPAPVDNPGYTASTHPQIRWGHHSIDGASGSNALAHGYFPGTTGLAGDVHFDTDNTFALTPGAAFDIIEVATHEFGHAIGLNHEPTPSNGISNAIMNPFYGGRYAGPGTAFLLADDIAGIQSVYGAGFGYVLDLSGTLNLSGTEGNNAFTLNLSGGNITATSAGFGSFTIPAAGVSGVVINGRGGADTVNITTSSIPVTVSGAAGDDVLAVNGVPIGSRFIGGAGNDTLNVNAGSFNFTTDAVADSANLTLNVNPDNSGAADVTLSATQHLAALNLGAGATVTMAADGNRYLYTKGLSINATAELDLNDNDLLLKYAGDAPYAQVRDWIVTGRDTGIGGITSSTGAAAGDRVHAPADNAIYGAGDWLGQPIDGQTIIAKYTYYGDGNLDGQVTTDDYVVVDLNLGRSNPQWIHGDVDFTGTTTTDDYVVIDLNLGKGTITPLATAESAEFTKVEFIVESTATQLVQATAPSKQKPGRKRS